jgi:hypothetical protein
MWFVAFGAVAVAFASLIALVVWLLITLVKLLR